MTLIRKVDKTGRSTRRFNTNNRMKIGAIFVRPRLKFGVASLARLSKSARRVLDRIELEHRYHGNAENGVPNRWTFENFEIWLDRQTRSTAIR